MKTCTRVLSLPLAAAFLLLAPAASPVTIDWVTVGDPGNPADTEVMLCCGSLTGTTGFGSVSYVYRISKFEVTNAQYAEFLNAAAAFDTNSLYNAQMSVSIHGGITQIGSSGGFTYSVKPGMGSKPVNYVSFDDSLRFANWLHNGQPTFLLDNSATEDGAYSLSTTGWRTRNVGASVFLPSESEWYKAAYYDDVSASYFDYPTATDVGPTCPAPTAEPNTANCSGGTITDVGAYSGSASTAGTFDQAGNVWEWVESPSPSEGEFVLQGGSSFGFLGPGSPAWAQVISPAGSAAEEFVIGFRVASIVPEPGTALLFALVGLSVCRRQRPA